MSINLTHRQAKVIEALKINPQRKSPKGWIVGGTCPFCHRNDKFGVRLNAERTQYRNHVSFNCFHGNCQKKGSEFSLLREMGLIHLIIDGEFIGNQEVIENRFKLLEDVVLDISAIKRYLPLGFRRVYDNEYLKSRGFESWQFEQYYIGQTKLDYRLREYVLFSIIEDGENKGYVARVELDKQEIKLRESQGKTVLRYNNEGGVDFAKLLFGIDEVNRFTTKVILVEGVTSKAGVDRLIRKMSDIHTVCLCTFGKKISDEQITKLWLRCEGRQIEIIVLYDPDAVDAVKTNSYSIKTWFNDVKIGYLYDKDPGDLTEVDQLLDVLSNLQTPDQFNSQMIQPKQLK